MWMCNHYKKTVMGIFFSKDDDKVIEKGQISVMVLFSYSNNTSSANFYVVNLNESLDSEINQKKIQKFKKDLLAFNGNIAIHIERVFPSNFIPAKIDKNILETLETKLALPLALQRPKNSITCTYISVSHITSEADKKLIAITMSRVLQQYGATTRNFNFKS